MASWTYTRTGGRMPTPGAADLVSQMTVREKISQMQHPTFLPRADGEIPSYLQEWCNEEGIGMLLIRELNSVEAPPTP